MPPRTAPSRGSGPPRGGGPARGRGAGRGGINVAIGAVGSNIRTVGIRRPGFGTGGKPVDIMVNAFTTTIPDLVLYHYDVDIKEKLPVRLNMILIDTLTHQTAPNVFSRPIVYDGRKNIYSTYALPLGPTDSASFDVSFARNTPAGDNPRPPKIYRVKVTKAQEINTQILHRFIDSKQSEDSAISTSLMALNTAIRMQPNMKYPFNVRSFFTPTGKRPIGGGIELWRGYFQSLRPSQGSMYINLDIATGIMYKSGPLLGLCLEFFNQNNPAIFTPIGNRPFPDRERLRLQRFLSGLRITTTHGARRSPRVIKRVTNEAASQIMFTNQQGNSISVAAYFQQILGRPLKFPHNVCVIVGTGAAIPLELCEVPEGQIMRKQIPSDKTNDVLEFSKLNPSQRLASIRSGLEVLQYGQSDYIREFGMNIAPTPINIKARILLPPTLKYHNSSKEPTIRPSNGQWNMRDKTLFQSCTINSWVIVVYERSNRFREEQVQAMATAFCDGASSVGIKVEDKRPLILYQNGQGDIINQLKQIRTACEKAKKPVPGLIVAVLPEGGNQIYSAVKHFGDVVVGVATQCLKYEKCRNAKIQYWANVMLKVNVKMGGINTILDNETIHDPHNPTIVMGADVMHPAPGADGRPSFASLVCSVDKNGAKYVAQSRVQDGNVEMIADLKGMCVAVLQKAIGYKAHFEKQTPPAKRLIFYRDGVSEGQFQQVLDQELPQIQAALREVKLDPKITLIVVGKRHHIRFFVVNPKDADRSGNCQAGTTVDQGLGHPTEFDYYQLTHGGLLGTSRPAHYSVIYDEYGFNADGMQNLSFALCHVYARATRSVSIPAPVYYADIVCARAKNHYTPGGNLDLSETGTQVTGSNAEAQAQAFKAGYQPLNPKMENLMYFM